MRNQTLKRNRGALRFNVQDTTFRITKHNAVIKITYGDNIVIKMMKKVHK